MSGDSAQVSLAGDTVGADRLLTAGDTSYVGLAAEYDVLLGHLAQRTWRQGVLVDVSRLGLQTVNVVVDLGSGTGIGGRLLGSIGGGHRIGVERCGAMLEQGTAWYEETLHTEVWDVPLPAASVDLVVSGFDSLNYLGPTALRRCLAEAGRLLKPTGWMIFDYSSPQLLSDKWRAGGHIDELADGALHWRHRYEPKRDRCVTALERRDGAGHTRWRETHVQYGLDTYQLHTLAAAAGLRVERVRDLHRQQFSPACNTHVWVMQRQVV